MIVFSRIVGGSALSLDDGLDHHSEIPRLQAVGRVALRRAIYLTRWVGGFCADVCGIVVTIDEGDETSVDLDIGFGQV